MASPPPKVGEQLVIQPLQIDRLIGILNGRGYRVMGPVVQEGAIVHEAISSSADLPVGWTDEQGAGRYRLLPIRNGALFGYNAGPQSWKKYLLPASLRLWRIRREKADHGGNGFQIVEEQPEPEKLAFFGVRSCDLHAIAVQDRVFLQGPSVDPGYKARRERAFIVAVNCTQAGANCFCASMNTGPKAESGFDLAITEVIEGEHHYLVVDVGTESGASIMEELTFTRAGEHEQSEAKRAVDRAAAEMGHRLDTKDLKEALYRSYDSPSWNEVATRCLACSNCTLVCPTCFCTTIEDVTDLDGEHAERWRKWDSCFTLDFSYIHGGSIRSSISSRYRQWLIHKLATWVDQFGTFGCVGCGRCITWCPVGIDIVEQARGIQNSTGTDIKK